MKHNNFAINLVKQNLIEKAMKDSTPKKYSVPMFEAAEIIGQLQERTIDPEGDNFGAVLNCAVRYSLGRRSYMPSLVIDFITPLLPKLSLKTLAVMENDIREAIAREDLGDPLIDAPKWVEFHAAVHAAELQKKTPKGGEQK